MELVRGVEKGEWGGEGYNGFSSAKDISKAERGMKVKKSDSSTALLPLRELLCFEGDKRREKSITYPA